MSCFLTRSSNGCEIQEPTCMKLDAATDPSGRDHSLGTQGRHWDYCSSLRVCWVHGPGSSKGDKFHRWVSGWGSCRFLGWSSGISYVNHRGKITSEPQVVVPASRRVKIMREIWSPRSTPGSCWVDRNSKELPPKLTLEPLKIKGWKMSMYWLIFRPSSTYPWGAIVFCLGLLIEQRQNYCCVIIPIGTEGPGACMIFELTFIYNQAPRWSFIISRVVFPIEQAEFPHAAKFKTAGKNSHHLIPQQRFVIHTQRTYHDLLQAFHLPKWKAVLFFRVVGVVGRGGFGNGKIFSGRWLKGTPLKKVMWVPVRVSKEL